MKRSKEKKSKIDKGTIYAITLIFVASVLITTFAQFPALTNRYTINDDVLQTAMYLPSCHDHELFQGDLLAKIKIQQAFPGIKFVYCALNFFFSIEMISKILPFILCFVMALYLFRIGKEIRGNSLGMLMALIFLVYSQTIRDSFVGGQMRAFGIAFLPIFLYYLIKKEYIKVSLIICLTMFFYPPLVLIFTLAYFMSVVERKKNFVFHFKNKRARNMFLLCIALIIISAFISLSFYRVTQKYSNIQDLLQNKSFFKYEEVMHMPEFGEHGRADSWAQVMNVSVRYIFSPEFIDNNIYNFNENPLLFRLLTIFLLFCSLAFWMLSGYKIPKMPVEIWNLLSASFLVSAVVYFTHPILSYLLFLAPRYLCFTVPLFLSLFVTINLNEFLEKTKHKKVTILLIIGTSLILLFFYINMFEYHLVSYEYPELYKFLSTLPKNSLIAGHPYQMDAVPLFTKRSVLVNSKSVHPAELKEWWPEFKNKTYDTFSVLYSLNEQEFNNFCKKYGVDYFVVDKFYYSDEYLNGKTYSKPFDDYIKNIAYEKKKTDFYLLNIPGNKKVWEGNNGTIFVVACNNV